MDHEERAVKIPIVERSVAYSVRVIRLYKSLMRDSAGRVIGHQLLRSATSVGANAHEAQAAQSRADFIAKMSIAHKEARESSYWLRLIDEAELVPTEKLAGLRDETDQLVRILSSILVSTKARPTQAEAKYPMVRESELSDEGYEYLLHS